MKRMLRLIAILTLCLLTILAMTGCSSDKIIDENKPTVVCTGFAQYDWVLNILGDEAGNWNVIRINDKGADMHSYQPSAEDMIVISKADLLIYTGGLSEEWIEDAIKSQNFQGEAYALLENGEPICLEDAHGHGEEDHDSSKDADHHGHSHDEYDEHIWLSLENAEAFCNDIAKLTNDIYPSETYNKNCQSYIKKLEDLKNRYENLMSGEDKNGHRGDNDHYGNTIIFADRFPFRYLAEDYDLTWYAAFPGCSAETEASFATIKALSGIVTEHQPSAIFVTETGDDSLAKTVINNAGFKEVTILEVNSMQSVSAKEETSYIEIMEQNLDLLWSVLS